MLHGADMRSREEKTHGPPKESDKFHAQVLPATPPGKEHTAWPEDPCIVVQGFPASWATAQMKCTFMAFGGVASVRFVPDPTYGRACHVTLKEADKMSHAASQLNRTIVGDGDFIEEC